MKRRGIQLSLRHKRWFYFVSVTLFLSGALWVLAGWLVEQGKVFAEALDTCQPWLLKIHGGAAMAFLVALGILIPTHIKRAWQVRRNRANGAFFVTVMGLLVVTGYGLYYFALDDTHALVSAAHWIVGLAAIGLFWTHLRIGRNSR